MTHFAGIVLAASVDHLPDLLERYDENNGGGGYDWYVIGGRFTGLLDGYDPASDPKNWEPCKWCEATGTTTQAIADEYPGYLSNVGKECIQCKGTASVRKFFNEPRPEGDVLPAEDVDLSTLRYIPSVLVTPDGEWHEEGQIGWFGTMSNQKDEDAWKREFVTAFEANKAGMVAALVDFHV